MPVLCYQLKNGWQMLIQDETELTIFPLYEASCEASHRDDHLQSTSSQQSRKSCKQ